MGMSGLCVHSGFMCTLCYCGPCIDTWELSPVYWRCCNNLVASWQLSETRNTHMCIINRASWLRPIGLCITDACAGFLSWKSHESNCYCLYVFGFSQCLDAGRNCREVREVHGATLSLFIALCWQFSKWTRVTPFGWWCPQITSLCWRINCDTIKIRQLACMDMKCFMTVVWVICESNLLFWIGKRSLPAKRCQILPHLVNLGGLFNDLVLTDVIS